MLVKCRSPGVGRYPYSSRHRVFEHCIDGFLHTLAILLSLKLRSERKSSEALEYVCQYVEVRATCNGQLAELQGTKTIANVGHVVGLAEARKCRKIW